jgi:hypothetical protein
MRNYTVPADRPRQCAWCGRIIGEKGRPVGEARPVLAGHSHGMCVECYVAQRRGPVKGAGAEV